MATHITGKYIAQNVGKKVVFEGYITKLSSDGKNVELTTFDKIKVNVALNEPYSDEASGIMQIFGTIKSKSTLSADSYVRFPPEDPEDIEFDPEDHNDLMTVLNVMGAQNILEGIDIVVDGPASEANHDEANVPNDFPDDDEIY